MHGRVKSVEREQEAKKTDEDRREELTKVRMYHEVADKVLALRAQRVLAAHLLPLTSHVLLLNPEFHVIWGYRREILLSLLDKHAQSATEEAMTPEEIAKTELKLTFEAIQRHPKSYSSWFQRQWIVDKGLCPDLKKEIALCNRLLDLDERNFHCWNYRRHVCQLAGVSREDELAFATLKIEQNFSNYSALHHRSITLPKPLTREILHDEIGIVQQAVFTEPDDQSAWFYYRWLVTSMLDVVQSEPSEAVEFLDSQIQWLLELLEMESEAKWVLVTLADLQRRLSVAQTEDEASASQAKEQSRVYYKQLLSVDPDHAQYYRDMIQRL
ncbi:hypothetical protein Poli38472_013732 [Pythium oligandrum]|uniref:Geranylgeranyl transferase type-2 subunit alpha n=1 Tax=Pythium oligandrum TaxID=41045 RepID=A0A8K1CD87_PYTOL|nr:hypothetical protein Poli38472_013732 [Pythium oligandrum]|eukprot:TMW61269.1 hypothetical protein Poli38472_013732 [Pythium oligandrum]